MAGLLRVVIVDDDPGLRQVLGTLLESHGGFEVVAEAGDGQQGIELAVEMQPDVLVLDLLMPTLSGRAVLPRVVRHCPRTMVAVLSALETAADIADGLARGAFAYYGKSRLRSVPAMLAADHEVFAAALDGHDTVPLWQRAAASTD